MAASLGRPCFLLFSGDVPVKILLDPNGDVVVAIYGIMSPNHPDYVVVKYDRDAGSTLWESTWGVSGGDFPTDMEIDAGATCMSPGPESISSTNTARSNCVGVTVSCAGSSDDALAQKTAREVSPWTVPAACSLTGASDPDGDFSNFNDDFFTVKRDAATGVLLWDSCLRRSLHRLL